MPNYGLAAIAQKWLARWEAAQAARYSAWSGASSVVGGVTAVVGTAGTMLKGSGTSLETAFAAAAQRWTAGPTGGLNFR